MNTFDDLQMYFGDDYVINDKITIHQPTMGDAIRVGEAEYYSAVYALTAISSDIKSALWDVGIDWNTFSDLETFALMTSQMEPEVTNLFFGGLDFTQFKLYKREDGLLFMKNNNDIIIDMYIHKKMSDFLCKVHHIKKKPEFAGNSRTKLVLVEDDRTRRNKHQSKEFQSQLLPLISSMVNSEGFKYGISDIRDMKLYAFMDSVARIQTIKSVEHLTTAYYTGNIDTKKFDTKKLDWLCDINKK